MRSILTFGASTSARSINADLARHAGHLLVASADGAVHHDHLDLREFEMPLYSVDREAADGVPPQAQAFLDRIAAADAVIVSFAEHNGTFTAAFKNTLDWASRRQQRVWQDRPVLVLAASPGGGGARSVLAHAATSVPFMGGRVVGQLSVPNFPQVWDPELQEITEGELAQRLGTHLDALRDAIDQPEWEAAA